MKLLPRNYKRIVIKIGSSLLYSQKTKLDCGLVDEISSQVSDLIKEGKEIMLVSSGAIALGMDVLKLSSRPKELSGLQAAAAVGQPELMEVYQKFFKAKQLNCAQVLLTWDDFNDRGRYLNAKNTLLKLVELGSVPIINENDTVSTDEIKFGDNDKLSSLVSILVEADLLIILSDIDGLLDKDKKTVIRVVDRITSGIKSLACPTDKKTCVGGMITKLEAADIAVASGIPCMIANGRKQSIISSCMINPESAGTLFLPKADSLAEKKRWIAFSTKPKGKIIVDEGAKKALMNKKSLLSVGIVECVGDFSPGDIVSLQDIKEKEFARGKAGLSCRELSKAKGSRHGKEAIHCNDIVIFDK